MGKSENIPLDPPTPTARAVRAHRRTLELSLDALKAGTAELALASARGKAGAQDALAALHAKIGAIMLEIECNDGAYELAVRQDIEAVADWRAAVQAMEDPDEVIVGITRDGCCHRCTPGVVGGCVITASDPRSAGAVCGHPVTQRHLFHLDNSGQRLFPYRDSPQASRIFDAACEKLKVRREFA